MRNGSLTPTAVQQSRPPRRWASTAASKMRPGIMMPSSHFSPSIAFAHSFSRLHRASAARRFHPRLLKPQARTERPRQRPQTLNALARSTAAAHSGAARLRQRQCRSGKGAGAGPVVATLAAACAPGPKPAALGHRCITADTAAGEGSKCRARPCSECHGPGGADAGA